MWSNFLGFLGFRRISRTPRQVRRPVRRRVQLTVESLEDRCLPSAGFTQISLVSDLPGVAQHTNPNLVNPWGIVQGADGLFRVALNGSGKAIVLNAHGETTGTTIIVPPPFGSPAGTVSAPTGIVFNKTSDFVISENGRSAPATFIFSTEDGTISGFNPKVDKTHAILPPSSDQSGNNAVYKGLALGHNFSGNFLFATNFRNDTIDVFKKNFSLVTLGENGWGTFTDPNPVAGFAPFGIQNIDGVLFVTFAKQNAEKHDDVAGPGNGFIDEFDTSGHFLERFASGTAAGGTLTQLNSPWGMTVAPSGYGPGGAFSKAFLVGNFGDSHVSAFNIFTGAFLGQLSDSMGNPLTLNGGVGGSDTKGLWGIAFGNGKGGTNPNTLYFAAGINDEADGLFGEVVAGQPRRRA